MNGKPPQARLWEVMRKLQRGAGTWRRSCSMRARTSRALRPAAARSAADALSPRPRVLSAAPTNSRGESAQATRPASRGCSRSPQSSIGVPPLLHAAHRIRCYSGCGLLSIFPHRCSGNWEEAFPLEPHLSSSSLRYAIRVQPQR